MSFGPDWVDAASRLPLGFAQVREDAQLDLEAVQRIGRKARVLMVASGGCTAAALAAAGNVALLHIVDPNPAQIALTRLKLKLLSDHEPQVRRALLGHRPMLPAERRGHLREKLETLGLGGEDLGPDDVVANEGPDFAGRYERVFLALRSALGDRLAEVESLLKLSDPLEQGRRSAPDTSLGVALDAALVRTMSLPNLVRLFGEEATRNPVDAFASHFSKRIRHVLGSLPAADNPYLWQMLLGCFPQRVASPWLVAGPCKSMPSLAWECDFMLGPLKRCVEKFDFVHLSNILDWLTPERAAETLEAAAAVLSAGGSVLVRQLNSSLDIPSLGPQFRWDREGALRLHSEDRSFFYRALHWGFKR